jgi:hypothetical protein
MAEVSSGTGKATLAAALRVVASRELGVSNDDGRLDEIAVILADLSKRASSLTGAEAHVAANQAASHIRDILGK